jgi:phage shock protein PspC (stress-responsive transcriptional regulator)
MNRRLYRSVVDRRIGGVAAGTATYFDIDPSISRVLWILLAIVSGGVFLIVYLVMWAVVPEEPYPAAGVGAAGTAAAAAGAAASEAPASGEASEKAPADAGATPSSWPPTAGQSTGPSGRVILGAILILIGAWFLADEFLPWLNWDLVWPIGLVVIGVLILATALRRPT